MSKQGSVVRWNESSGFGFIEQGAGNPDIFVHRSGLVGVDILHVGDKCSYEAIYDDKKSKWMAVNVHVTSAQLSPPPHVPPTFNPHMAPGHYGMQPPMHGQSTMSPGMSPADAPPMGYGYPGYGYPPMQGYGYPPQGYGAPPPHMQQQPPPGNNYGSYGQ